MNVTHHPPKSLNILKQVAPAIQGKVVVEVGAGIGLLAIGMASIAREVYAIETDPAWSWEFTKVLYELKQPNLTFVFGNAQTMIGKIKGDVAIVVTRSGVDEMRQIAQQFAPVVVMPLQGISS